MDREYDGMLYKEKANEYDKHIELLKGINIDKNKNITVENKKVFNVIRPIPNLIKGEFITLAPLSSDIKRSWGLENYKSLCEKLSSKYKIVLLGSENEKDKLEFIKNGNENILNTGGMYNISDLPSIIKKSVLYIGNDSGLTHIALKLDVPLIAIIGGGNYGKFFPLEEENPKVVYLYDEMDCFGCDWNCIYKERFCLTNVTLDEVVSALTLLFNYKE